METTLPQPREVEAGRGWNWIVQGFELFKKAPGTWIGVFALWGVIYLAASIMPLGGIITPLLANMLQGGWMLGCRKLDSGGELGVEDLFAGFKGEYLSQLVLVGALYLCGFMAICLTVGIVVGGSLLPLLFGKASADFHITVGFLVACLLLLALLAPLMMAAWFAPALIVFEQRPAIDAMKASFAAGFANAVPFLVYGLIVLGLGLAAAIPFGLGLIVLGPIVIASVYASYCDIFRFTARPAGG